jgi:hypothetical protein
MIVGTLDASAADSPSVGPVSGVVHAVGVVGEIGDEFVDLFSGLEAGRTESFQRGKDGLYSPVLQQSTLSASPFSGLGCPVPIEGTGDVPDSVFGMKKVENELDLPREILGEFSDPMGSVAQQDKRVGLVKALTKHFGPKESGKVQPVAEMGNVFLVEDDSSLVAFGAAIVSSVQDGILHFLSLHDISPSFSTAMSRSRDRPLWVQLSGHGKDAIDLDIGNGRSYWHGIRRARNGANRAVLFHGPSHLGVLVL